MSPVSTAGGESWLVGSLEAKRRLVVEGREREGCGVEEEAGVEEVEASGNGSQPHATAPAPPAPPHRPIAQHLTATTTISPLPPSPSSFLSSLFPTMRPMRPMRCDKELDIKCGTCVCVPLENTHGSV